MAALAKAKTWVNIIATAGALAISIYSTIVATLETKAGAGYKELAQQVIMLQQWVRKDADEIYQLRKELDALKSRPIPRMSPRRLPAPPPTTIDRLLAK